MDYIALFLRQIPNDIVLIARRCVSRFTGEESVHTKTGTAFGSTRFLL